VTTIIEMIREAGPGIGIIGTSMIEEDMERIFRHPQVLICSDGGISGRHPRGYGAFPRVLARYVREKGLLPLEEAIAKMTGRSAARLGMPERGTIAAGKFADIVVFDPRRRSRTTARPRRRTWRRWASATSSSTAKSCCATAR
jgi:N-acyl-D-amino-acid deacylase